MSEALWAPRPRPAPGPDETTVGVWAPAGLGDLTADRRALAAAIGGQLHPAGDEAADRLLLAFEELVSNGLRHGLPPVRASVIAFDGRWLLEVSDAAVHRPPAPAWQRDAARGGLGLPMVARICVAHGWHTDGARKNVWALLPQSGTALTRTVPDTAAAGGAVADRLREVAAGFTGALGFPPAIRFAGPVDRLTADLVDNLARVISEGLANVAAHAHAGSVVVTIEVTPDLVRALVCDDGVGMAGGPRDGGLADLRRRATWYGGSVCAEPSQPGGTQLEWTVPLRPVPLPRPGGTTASAAR